MIPSVTQPAPAGPRATWRLLAPGAIRPSGWLLDQLRLQAAGQTGRLEEIWADVGPDSGWKGGPGECWERGPYYLDGLVPLAHVLDDAGLKATARPWIEWILAGQRTDGSFGPRANDDWWPRMVAAKVLTQHADATGDPRIVPFLQRYFAYQQAHLEERPLEGWGRARGADNVLSIMWLHDRAPADTLLDLARLVLRQTDDWVRFLTEDLPSGPTPTFAHLTHCVNVAMGLKTAAVATLVDGQDRSHETAAMFAALDREHGLVHGAHSGDEWLAGRAPHHGVETCEVVELMFTLEQLVAILHDGRYADRLELVAYNLLPASNDPQMLAHQYHQQANQIEVSFADRDWTFAGPDANVFGLEPHFGCCTANLHQGWPKLVRSLWLQEDERTLVAVSYAPCMVRTTLAGVEVTLDVATTYPFTETVAIRVGVADPASFGLRLRIPGWCTAPRLVVAGADHDATPGPDGYLLVRRTWSDGDLVTLTLPMTLRVEPRDAGTVGLRLGPLVLVHGIGEIWRPVPDHTGLAEWEISPRGFWNLGVWVDDPAGIESWPVTRSSVGPVPFASADAPVLVCGLGAQVREWQRVQGSAGPVPAGPVKTKMPQQEIRLVPYGCARIRIAEFPTVMIT